MAIIDPDKKVEKAKKKRESVYQSSQHPEHFKNEGSEYQDLGTEKQTDNEIEEEYDRTHGLNDNSKRKDQEKSSIKKADDIEAGEDSAIPGSSEKKNIGTASSGAGLGGNQGRGTSDFSQ